MDLNKVDEIHKYMLDNISDNYEKSEGNLIYDLLRAFAIEKAEVDTFADNIKDKIYIENLNDKELERYVWQRRGIKRKAARKSTGILSVLGNGILAKGSLFETELGTQFISTETISITNSATVKIEAVNAGISGNVGANTISLMPITIQGISSVTNLLQTSNGYEAESNESLIDRYYTELQKPATSGNIYHYLLWAREITGVGNAKVFPLERGANTVEIVIIDDDMKPVSVEILEEVQNHIDPNSNGKGEGSAPIGAKCYVVSASPVSINISVSIVKSAIKTDEQLKNEIISNVEEYLKSVAFKQKTISYAKIGSLILSIEGIDDYSDLLVNQSVENINVPDKSVAILGGVSLV